MKTVPFCIDDLEKIPDVSESVKSMLKGHPSVIFERGAPYCFLSRIEDSYAELTFGCTLRNKVNFFPMSTVLVKFQTFLPFSLLN